MPRRLNAIFSLFPLLALLWGTTLIAVPSWGIDGSLDPVQTAIRRRLDNQSATGMPTCRGELISGMEMMPLAYRGRDYRPFWIDAHHRLQAVNTLVEAIGRAGEDGLRPVDYHLAAIYRLLTEMAQERAEKKTVAPEQWGDLDLLLTDAFLLLGAHLFTGKVDPNTLDAQWRIDPRRVTLLPLLIHAATTADAESALNVLRPSHEGYAQLQRALSRLRKVAEAGGWPRVDGLPTLRPGDRGDGVRTLRRRLAAGGDLDATAQGDDPRYYDAGLAEVVKGFQRRHGLKDDGIVGPGTIGALNVPMEKRLRQAEINLERWRWLPHRLESRFIMVNTAAFTLDAVDSGQVALRMRVVVGRPARRSPVLNSIISHLVINPYWTIPATIAVEDILPAVKKDAAYLTERGIRVYPAWTADAVEIDPSTVDWRAYHAGRFPFTLRQDPGPHNALGRIKFMLPNAYAVYLHGTPDHALFNRVQRDLSSGCIRVEDPLALARFLLPEDASQPAPDLKERVDSGQTSTIRLGRPVAVHLLYMTAWTDAGGALQFRDDIYHQDLSLDRALSQTRPGPPAADAQHALGTTDGR